MNNSRTKDFFEIFVVFLVLSGPLTSLKHLWSNGEVAVLLSTALGRLHGWRNLISSPRSAIGIMS